MHVEHIPSLKATDGSFLCLQINATIPWRSVAPTELIYLNPKSETYFYWEGVVIHLAVARKLSVSIS